MSNIEFENSDANFEGSFNGTSSKNAFLAPKVRKVVKSVGSKTSHSLGGTQRHNPKIDIVEPKGAQYFSV